MTRLIPFLLATSHAFHVGTAPAKLSTLHVATSPSFHSPYVQHIHQLQETDTEVNFPPPLNKWDRFQRAAAFWASTVPIVAQYYGLVSQIKLQEIMGSTLTEEAIEAMWDEKHQDGAVKMAETISNLKGKSISFLLRCI
jgi:hypothetical protein